MATPDSPLETIRRRFRTALCESRLRTALAAAVGTSRVLTMPSILSHAVAHARITRGLRTAKRWGRHSALYRWLTAEPDPDIVVIDLRETYTVGTVISVLDRLAAPLSRSYRVSGLRRLANGTGGVASTLAATRIGQALGRVRVPPEPPDSAPDSDTQPEDDSADSR